MYWDKGQSSGRKSKAMCKAFAWKASLSFFEISFTSSKSFWSMNRISVAMQKYADVMSTTFSSIVSFVSSWVFSILAFSSYSFIIFRCITFPIFRLKIQSCEFLTPRVFLTLSLNRKSFSIWIKSCIVENEIFSLLLLSRKSVSPYFLIIS